MAVRSPKRCAIELAGLGLADGTAGRGDLRDSAGGLSSSVDVRLSVSLNITKTADTPAA